MKPLRLLDLFCGAGGAAMGYHRVGFEVVGVDIKPQKHYPFEFHQANAMTYPLGGFDVIHASPPCQQYSLAMKHLVTREYGAFIPAIRQRLKLAHLPYVIENVRGAPLKNSIVICGSQLGLRIHRHRLFEVPFFVLVQSCGLNQTPINPYCSESRQRIYDEFGRHDPEKIWSKEMGIGWMSRYEAREAIPPAYTEFIGKQLIMEIFEKEGHRKV